MSVVSVSASVSASVNERHTLSYDRCPSFLASVAGTVPWRRVGAKTES